MRRTMLYISLALFTFAVGLLTVGTFRQLAVALPVALMVFILLKKITDLNVTLHYLKVVFLTLLIWTPFAAFTLGVVMPKTGSCVVELSEEESLALRVEERGEFTGAIIPEATECSSPSIVDRDKGDTNTIWAGVIDDKAMSKPAPYYPRMMKASGIATTVAVSVVIEGATGKVMAAQALSGHPLVRQSAVEAAYRARFHPACVNGIAPNVSGILTYRFGL
jgi:hypothetical protein